MTTSLLSPYQVPVERFASEPPEERGAGRDDVALMVVSLAGIEHTRFPHLGDHLTPGDLLVVNTSPTLPAALPGSYAGAPVTVHLATPSPSDDAPLRWTIEIRQPDRTGPVLDAAAGEMIELPAGGAAVLVAPSDGRTGGGVRLWSAVLDLPGPLPGYLDLYGAPIRYAYVPRPWPLERYQTVFALPARHGLGSAEMASAARPFTPRLVTSLVAQGVNFAPITLHTGVSSLAAGEDPQPEWFEVPPGTVRMIELVRRAGGRVIAVGTSATRALESAAAGGEGLRPMSGWTDLVLEAATPATVVDGLITGWHEPDASHMRLLAAVAGEELVAAAYAAALAGEYRWHEFGDSCLLLPARG